MATHNHVFSLSSDIIKNELVGLYIVAKMSYLKKLYSFNNMGTWPRIKEHTIHLPITKNHEIDFGFIENYMLELEGQRIQELEAFLKEAGFDECSLSEEEKRAILSINQGEKQMQKFSIVKIFEVANSHNILKSEVVFGSGAIPYVTASQDNNSIVSYISYKREMMEKGNSIMIGGKTLVITYQPRDFFSNDSHNLVLKIRDEKGRNESTQLFIVTALYKTLGPKYSWGDSISNSKIQKDVVYLPVKEDGQIDYEFMAIYINALKKQCIERLEKEMKLKKATYETVNPRILPIFKDYQEGYVPLYTLRAACGYFEEGIVPQEEGWVKACGYGFTPNKERYFAVHAKGNSMFPKIKDGDICVFEWYNQIGGSREGEIVLTQSSEIDLEYGGKYTIKKYHSEKSTDSDGSWRHTKVELIPLNPEYSAIELDKEHDYKTIGILKCVLKAETT